MTDLHLCPSCRRHVRIDESHCPFCEASLAPGKPRAVTKGRFTRAAVFAGALAGTALTGAACSGGQKQTGDPNPPAMSDAGATEQVESVADAGMAQDVKDPPDDIKKDPPPHDIPVDMPYGAPPVRHRLV